MWDLTGLAVTRVLHCLVFARQSDIPIVRVTVNYNHKLWLHTLPPCYLQEFRHCSKLDLSSLETYTRNPVTGSQDPPQRDGIKQDYGANLRVAVLLPTLIQII